VRFPAFCLAVSAVADCAYLPKIFDNEADPDLFSLP